MPIFVESPASSGLIGYRTALLSGEQGTAQTIDLMRRLVDDALADQSFVRKAVDIVKSVPAYDDYGELRALYDWVQQNIRFTKDPLTKEKLYPPQELLKIRAGDCDDISMLLGAFALALGYPARLITIAASSDHPDEFSHVYVEAEVPPNSGNWIPLDAARVDAEFGVEPPVSYRKRAWSLTDNSYQDLAGSFVHANTVGAPGCRRMFAGLGSYGYVRSGIGDVSDYMPVLQQSVAEIPTIISAVTGGKSQVAGPYGSFATGFTPGYGIPPAGYVAPGMPGAGAAVSASGSPLLLLALGGGLLLMLMMGRR